MVIYIIRVAMQQTSTLWIKKDQVINMHVMTDDSIWNKAVSVDKHWRHNLCSHHFNRANFTLRPCSP